MQYKEWWPIHNTVSKGCHCSHNILGHNFTHIFPLFPFTLKIQQWGYGTSIMVAPKMQMEQIYGLVCVRIHQEHKNERYIYSLTLMICAFELSMMVKVRARFSQPLQRGHGKHDSRGANLAGCNSILMARPSWSRPAPRSLPAHMVRGIGIRVPPVRPVSLRDRRPVMPMPVRGRPVAPPTRSYDRRPTAPAYPKRCIKRDYGRREDVPPRRSKVCVDYGSWVASQRWPCYRDYPACGLGYSELPRSISHTALRRGYVDDGYGQRFERSPPPPHLSYREGHPRDYDTLFGSKHPYTAIDDDPPRYVDTSVH